MKHQTAITNFVYRAGARAPVAPNAIYIGRRVKLTKPHRWGHSSGPKNASIPQLGCTGKIIKVVQRSKFSSCAVYQIAWDSPTIIRNWEKKTEEIEFI